jgi:hypothetical protein
MAFIPVFADEASVGAIDARLTSALGWTKRGARLNLDEAPSCSATPQPDNGRAHRIGPFRALAG